MAQSVQAVPAPLQIRPAAAQSVHVGPQWAAESHPRHVPASHQLPAPQSTEVAQFWHTPFAHPYWQARSVDGYVQRPPAQAPGLEEMRSVFGPTQYAAGGATQLTPTQGSPEHIPVEQPNAQCSVRVPYWHAPPTQAPGVSCTTSVLASWQ